MMSGSRNAFENFCRKHDITPNPETVLVVRERKEGEKEAQKPNSRLSATDYANLCRAFDFAPNKITMQSLKQLDEEERAKKSESKN